VVPDELGTAPEGGLGEPVLAVGPQDVLQELQEHTKDQRACLDRLSTMETSCEHLAKALDDQINILAVWDDLG